MITRMGGLVRLEILPISSADATLDMASRRKVILSPGSSWKDLPLVLFSSTLEDTSKDDSFSSLSFSLMLRPSSDYSEAWLDAILRYGCLLRLHFADLTVMIAGTKDFPVHGTLSHGKGTRPSDSSCLTINAECSSPMLHEI